MVQVTKDFVRIHATVHYPDGYSDKSQQNVSYVDRWDRGNTIELREITNGSWYAGHSGDSDSDPYIQHTCPEEETTTLSTENFERIEGGYSENLVAVAEVSVEKTVEEERWLRSDKVSYEASIDELTIWEQAEWEVHESSQA